jgi:hypothetical protein
MSANRLQSTTPLTDHLWQMGFNVESKAERLAVPLDDGNGNLFLTSFEIRAYPERGEARRHFAGAGPAFAEVRSNLPLEQFQHELDRKQTALKDLYTERCAKVMLEMLVEQANVSLPTS